MKSVRNWGEEIDSKILEILTFSKSGAFANKEWIEKDFSWWSENSVSIEFRNRCNLLFNEKYHERLSYEEFISYVEVQYVKFKRLYNE